MDNHSDFITISELSNLTGVNIKSLRYYEQQGVLKPAYTNPKTRYRYYTCSQIPIIQLIQFFTETGIPLRELQPYINADTQSIRLRDSLFYGLANAQHRLSNLQKAIEQAETLLEETDRADELLHVSQVVTRKIPTKICYSIPVYGSMDEKLYYTSLRHVLRDMHKQNITPGPESGILHFRADNNPQTFVYSTVNISQKDITDDTHFIKIPAQTFHCRTGDFSIIASEEMQDYYGGENLPEFWMLTEIYPSNFDYKKPIYEFRWTGNPAG